MNAGILGKLTREEVIGLSLARRQQLARHCSQRWAERIVRCEAVALRHWAGVEGVPAVRVAAGLGMCPRTLRRWEQAEKRREMQGLEEPVLRGRPPRCATRSERNEVFQFLRERGPETPLAALRAAFPHLVRTDLENILRRYRRITQRKARWHKSRLVWHRPGTVWGADFKERREPLEARYPYILSVRDLGSHYQLVWQPVAQATAEVVQAVYRRLFAEYGPPLVLKSDNGGQFRAEETKQLLAESGVTPLYNPKRRPSYNGAVEHANLTNTSYQEALAEFRGRPGMPTCEDAESARQLANELARPDGWRGPTAGQLWAQRMPIGQDERAAFLATVEQRRADVRTQFDFAPDEALRHYPQAAVDRRAVRDALVQHGLLTILPRSKRSSAARSRQKSLLVTTPDAHFAGILRQASMNPPTFGGSLDPAPATATGSSPSSEEAQYSTQNSTASGQY